MAHYIFAGEAREGDAPYILEHFLRIHESAALSACQVDLRDVACDHGFGAEADTRQEHLHLLERGVLRLIEDDERVVERAPTHVGERTNLDRAALEKLADLLEAHEIVQSVVQRTQIRIDLLCEIAGKEAQSLSSFDGGAHQHDALHRIALEGVYCRGDREVG